MGTKTTVQVAIAACTVIVWVWSPFSVQAQAPACPEARPSEDELTRIRIAITPRYRTAHSRAPYRQKHDFTAQALDPYESHDRSSRPL